MSIADEIRADFKRIKDRYLGLPDAIGSIRVSTIEKVERHISDVEAELAKAKAHKLCAHCDLFVEEHQIREVPAPYLSMEQARIDRLNDGDKQIAQGMGQ